MCSELTQYESDRMSMRTGRPELSAVHMCSVD